MNQRLPSAATLGAKVDGSALTTSGRRTGALQPSAASIAAIAAADVTSDGFSCFGDDCFSAPRR